MKLEWYLFNGNSGDAFHFITQNVPGARRVSTRNEKTIFKKGFI